MLTRMSMHIVRLAHLAALAAVIALFITGCLAQTGLENKASDGEGSDGTGDCSTFEWGGIDGVPTANANWQYIQSNVFAGSGTCTNCHTGAGNGPSNLSLDSDQYDGVVTDRLMSGYPDNPLAIIEIGSKECSFLYTKISTDDDILVSERLGSRMPLNKNPLSQSDIDLIGSWIDEGAIRGTSP